jgi:Yip1 domain
METTELGTLDTPKNSSMSYFEHFLITVYEGLFDAVALYERIATGWPRETRHGLYATFWVFALATFGTLLEGSFSRFDGTTLFSAAFAGLTGMGIWLLTGLTFASIAYCFRSQGKPLLLLTLTGYAVLPWLFLGPLFLLRNTLGVVGELVHVTGLILLWVWSTVLFLLALQKTYNLSMDRVLLMGLVPVLAGTLGWVWLFQVFSSLLTVLS